MTKQRGTCPDCHKRVEISPRTGLIKAHYSEPRLRIFWCTGTGKEAQR